MAATLSHAVLLLLALASALLPSHAAPPPRDSRFYAAKCLEFSRGCEPSLAAMTDASCIAHEHATAQPRECRHLACAWCLAPGMNNAGPCRHARLREMCNLDNAAAAPPKTGGGVVPPTQGNDQHKQDSGAGAPSEKCDGVWYGREKIVVNFDRVPVVPGWTANSVFGVPGLEYERNKNRGIDGAGKRGAMCFHLESSLSGAMFATMISYAPHNTEHNDMFVRSPDLGFELYKGWSLWKKTYGYLKAYQNDGKEVISKKMKTKDFDGHRFVIPNVEAGKRFRVCVSGRSYRFTVFAMAFVHCDGSCKYGKLLAPLNARDRGMCKKAE